VANLPASNIFYRKTRTGIGILAVAVEVALVLVLVGLALGTINEVADRMVNVGADIIFQDGDASPIFVLNSGVMSERLGEKLAEVPGVARVAAVLTGRVTKIREKNKIVQVFGVNPDSYGRIGRGIDIVEGEVPATAEQVAVDTVLSSADRIRVGDSLPMLGRDFVVSGIFRAGAGARIYLRLDALQESTAQPGKASFFFIKVAQGEKVGEVAARLERAFKGYKVTALESFAEELQRNALGLQDFIRVVSGLAAFISFLVILLAMYTTIIERTREIGVLKALGAGKLYIMRLVMIESFIICSIGVVIGFGLSIAGRAWLGVAFPTLSVALVPRWFLFAAFLGIGGGLLGSLYPAYRAASLDPVEALNFE
jgi:putative ABC transport system permease protein